MRRPECKRSARHFALLAASALAASQALAHSVAVSRGELWIESDALLARLDFFADDLLDRCVGLSDGKAVSAWHALDDCALRFADELVENLIIRDESGLRIKGECLTVEHDFRDRSASALDAARGAQVSYRLRYAVPSPPRFLTLQQLLFREGPSHASQLVLALRASPDDPGCRVQLTNRGNVETMCIAGNAGTRGARITAHPGLRAPRTQLVVQTSSIQLVVEMPFALLETWSLGERAEADFLTTAEQGAAAERFSHLLRTRTILRINDQPAAPREIAVRVLSPAEEWDDPVIPRRLGAWSARVMARIDFQAPGPPEEVCLTWDLFNGAILQADAAVIAGASRTEQILTPYAPILRWSRR